MLEAGQHAPEPLGEKPEVGAQHSEMLKRPERPRLEVEGERMVHLSERHQKLETEPQLSRQAVELMTNSGERSGAEARWIDEL